MSAQGRSVIDEVKSRLDVVDIVGSKVDLRRAGKSFKGLCPFHNEKSPSFIVNPERQSYHCFGCGKSGDAISFLMETDKLDFKDALKQLAESVGVRIEAPKPVDEGVQTQQNRLLELNRLTARYYNHLLTTSPDAEEARKYLIGRGVERVAWEAWTLGYAPDSWDTTLKFLQGRGYSTQEMLAAGLIIERTGGGGQYDRFRKRIMFPIRDKHGDTIAFGGRAMGDAKPKYMNSPESAVFTKGEHFYGLDLAQAAIKDTRLAVIVEGYVDAVVAHTYGFANVIATLGTALTPAHVRLLSKLTHNVCLALDADAAGDTAAMRGWETLRDAVRRRRIPIRDRSGRVIAHEQRLDMDVRIARLPRGEDPDTLIRNAPEEWKRLIAEARSVVEHFFAVVTEAHDLTTVQGRSQVVAELAPVIADIGNPIEKAAYVSRLAGLVKVGEVEIQAQVARSRQARRAGQQATLDFGGLGKVSQEELTLALLIRYPRLLAETPPDFEDLLEETENKQVYELLRELGPERLTPENLVEAAQGPLAEHVGGLMGLVEAQPELLLNRQPEELRRRLGLIRFRRLKEQLNEVSQLLQEATEMGDQSGVRALMEVVPSLASELRQFDPPKSPYFKDSRE